MTLTAAQLVEQVQGLLHDQGLTPQLSPKYVGMAHAGAARLLDAMGLQPTTDVPGEPVERDLLEEPGEPQTYNPYELVDQIQASARTLLREQGVVPQIPRGRYGDALAGAGRLLRAMGIQPAMSVADRGALDLDHDLMRDR